jgi:hypothetical protein
MGGFGSGRRPSSAAKTLTSSLRSIDIRRWQREGLLRPGFPFTRVWRESGEIEASVRVRLAGNHLLLGYTLHSTQTRLSTQEISVELFSTNCHLGGTRLWFLCPQPGCGRQAAVLYERGRFACRHCLGLAYPSQRESPSDRALRRAERVRTRLGWEPWECSVYGRRPKGMHRTTFMRLQAQRACLMIQALTGVNKRMESVLDYFDTRA